MRVDQIGPRYGARKKPKRVGRGTGGKGGKTAGRGTKGQYARNTVARGFEGGQMPLVRRVPKFGFKNINRKEFHGINIATLQRLVEKLGINSIDPEIMVANGLASSKDRIKILGKGEISAKVDVKAHAFSEKAIKTIESAGGTASKI